MNARAPRYHVRVRFIEVGKVRFVSHRDVARLFERALRKLRLPVAYSEGFSPRPKLSFGLALSVSHESDAEYLDIELTERPDVESLASALNGALPDGITVTKVIALRQGAASLQQAITSCTWRLEVLGATEDEVTAAVAETLASSEVMIERTRKGKTTEADVRPAILDLQIVGPTEHGVELLVELATKPVSLRPTEMVLALGIEGLNEGRVRRTHQWMIVDGVRREPVSAPEPSMGHELTRVS